MLFSIIIPTYNRVKLLSRAVKSVLNQTFDSWELIIIDNYSTDGTEQLINKFNNEKIKFIKIKNNGIIAKSRNLGINESKGEFIAFLDSDDWWYNDKLEKISKELSESDFIYHNMHVYENGKKTNKKLRVRKLKEPIINDLMIKANAIINSSVVIRTKILKVSGLLDEDRSIASVEDYDLWLRIARETNAFKLVPDYLGGYEVHSNNMSNFSSNSIEKIEEVYNRNINYLPDSKKAMATFTKYYTIGRIHYELRNYVEAQTFFKRSIKTNIIEFKLKSLVMLLLVLIKNTFFKHDKN